MRRVDYEQVAPVYDRRFRDGGPQELAALVRARCAGAGDRPVLDVGCGTGRWLVEAMGTGHEAAVGLDPSKAMLARAREHAPAAALVRGRAESLPFRDGLFGAVLCIYVVHHLDDAGRFVAEAARVLAVGGTLDVLALAPHDGQDRWYVYDHFDGVIEADRVRYPPTSTVAAWMMEAGLTDVRVEVAAHIAHTASGASVLDDPILHRHGTCQLSLLSHGDFERGMARIHAEAGRAPAVSFVTDLRIFATTGRRPVP